MKILVASPYLPWPLDSGGNAALFSCLQCLSADHAFTLICPIYSPLQEANARELARQLPGVKVRAVPCGAPRPHPVLKALAWTKTKARELIKGPRPPTHESNAPFYPFSPLHPAFISALADELQHAPDICQIEFAELLPLAVWLPPGLPKLFVHLQVHFVYAERFVAAHGKNPYADYLTELMRAQELLYLRHYQAIVALSDADQRAMNSAPGMPPVHICPFPIPADLGIAEDIPPAFDGRFLFLGSEAHDPNREGLRWLLLEIWPLIIAALPDARLIVIGAWSEAWTKTTQAQGLAYAGFVPDLAGVLRGGTMLVPLRIGSGLRTKILAALAQGVPVISTAIGAEGLLVSDGEDLLIRDESAAFAEAALQIAKDAMLWKRLARNGRETVIKHYSPAEVRRRRNEIYASLAMPKAAPGASAISA